MEWNYSVYVHGISYEKGTPVSFTQVPVYASPDAKYPKTTVTGTYYFYGWAIPDYPMFFRQIAVSSEEFGDVLGYVDTDNMPYKLYQISYDLKGGAPQIPAQAKKWGTPLKLSKIIPTRVGYEFVAWVTKASMFYQPGDSFQLEKDTVLEALWKEKQYTITYNADGGTVIPESVVQPYGQPVHLPTPVKEGYRFLRWETGDTHTPVQPTDTVTSDLHLIAVWQKLVYKLHIDPANGTYNGASGITDITGSPGETVTLVIPVRTGFQFAGWYRTGEGSLNGNTFTFGKGAATLTAYWRKKEYSIVFDAGTNGGTGGGIIDYNLNEQLGELPEATKPHHTFLGWFTAPVGGTKITSETTVTGNTTYYAYFRLNISCNYHNGVAWKLATGYIYSKGRWRKFSFHIYLREHYRQGTGIDG